MRDERTLLTEGDMLELVGECDIRTYVETGTLEGEQLEIATRVFPRVIGLELDEHYTQVSRKRAPLAKVIQGDSRELIHKLDMNEAAFWLLDAHYFELAEPSLEKSPFPLWDELVFLRGRSYPDIIAVDDVHTFGKKRDELRYGDALEWEGVTQESISSFLGCPRGQEVKGSYVVWRP